MEDGRLSRRVSIHGKTKNQTANPMFSGSRSQTTLLRIMSGVREVHILVVGTTLGYMSKRNSMHSLVMKLQQKPHQQPALHRQLLWLDSSDVASTAKSQQSAVTTAVFASV